MAKMAKWNEELDIFRRIKPCIILEGNILDKFHYAQDPPQRIRYLPDYVWQYLWAAGYSAMAFFDEARGLFGSSEYGSAEQGIAELRKLCRDLPGMNRNTDSIPCEFAGSSDAGGRRTAEEAARVTIGTVLKTVLGQTSTPAAIIMDMASRYIISPEQMQQGDVRAYTDILRALRQAKVAMKDGQCMQNLLILLVNKLNDVPAWFYLNNPDVKAIHIDTPDSDMRREFISGENLSAFFDEQIWEEDRAMLTGGGEQLRKLQERFVGMTTGFTYADLIGMRALCQNGGYHLTQLPSVVELYRYGIKENKWAALQKETVDRLEKDMLENILGQETAIRKVMDVVKRSTLLKGSGSNRPKGVLFFAGPTGTGKTETAKALARGIFGDESCCIRFDMSEYRQDQSDQRLLGAPPGYIGYEAGGQLTNAVRERPFSIILFDEIEKAHPSILDKFLQILDDGRLTDGQGNTVYFSESIIIFTSNRGIITQVEEIDENGFPRTRNKQLINPDTCSTQKVQEEVTQAIKDYFKYTLSRPELLNRIGESNIVVYDFIRRGEVAEKILDKQVQLQLATLENDLEIKLLLEQEARETLQRLVLTTEVLENGGRGIRNAVEAMLFTPLSRYLFNQGVQAGQTVVIHNLEQAASSIIDITAEVKP